MKLRIGLIGLQPGWQIILQQIGIFYDIISDAGNISPENYSTLIIPEKIDAIYHNSVLNYLISGGSVLFCTQGYKNLFGVYSKTKKVTYLLPDSNSIFSRIDLIDINSQIEIPQSSNLQVLDEGLSIFRQQVGKGCLIVIPYDINLLILDSSSIRKKFFAERKELPSEIVASVSKGKLRKIIALSLEYLHHQRGLPFVHKWYYPQGWKGLFIFRLDTDFCSMEDAESMYEICSKNNIEATWFLDTESEDRLQNYSKMEEQEMALHCERHLVFDDYESNSNNLKTALSKLEKVSIGPKGFAAPFGDWNRALAQVLEDMDFAYSSEFTLDYDDLPYFPPLKDGFSTVLQIPIHPISSGRLRRSHFSEEEMLEYFRKLIEKKQELNEPIIIYHHPHHQHFEVFDEVFKIINEKKIRNITMFEYAGWWEKRIQVNPDLKYEGNEITSGHSEEDIYLRISTKDGDAITNMSTRILLSKLDLKQPEKIIQTEKIERTRKKHWRDLLYNYESRKRKSEK